MLLVRKVKFGAPTTIQKAEVELLLEENKSDL
jgi:hypothetical protein